MSESAIKSALDGTFVRYDITSGAFLEGRVKKEFIPNYKPAPLPRKPKSRGKRINWTPELDAKLLAHREAGRTFKEFAEQIGCTAVAVLYRLRTLLGMPR